MSLGETSNPDGWKHTRKPESMNLHWYKVKFKAHQENKYEKKNKKNLSTLTSQKKKKKK